MARVGTRGNSFFVARHFTTRSAEIKSHKAVAMGLLHVLAFVWLTIGCLERSGAIPIDHKRVNMPMLVQPRAPLWESHRATTKKAHKTKSLLRKLRSKEAEDDLARSDDERVGGLTSVLARVGNAVKVKAETKLWLALGLTPEHVLSILNVASKEDENYKIYIKYFFQYYVKYLDESLSHFPPSTIDDIWNARLHDWIVSTLTPPQVFRRLGFTGSWALARGQPNYKYFEKYLKMWGDMQVRESKKHT